MGCKFGISHERTKVFFKNNYGALPIPTIQIETSNILLFMFFQFLKDMKKFFFSPLGNAKKYQKNERIYFVL